MRGDVSLPLFWRVCLINGAVFAAGTAVLALSPATVSTRPLVSEVVVLAVGLAVIVVVNGLLLRSVLRPLDRLAAAMGTVDLREPGTRLDEAHAGPAGRLVQGFNAMLERLESERAASTARALQAQEAERQRIAQELHDEVGQSLTAVLLDLRHGLDLAPAGLAPVLEGARATTRASLEEVRRISQALRPGVLADLGLLNSLSSLASDFTSRTGVPVVRGLAPGLPSLTPEVELVVYRVAQEAVTNVARHAGASTVRLGLCRHGDRLELVVEDDGVGGAGGGGAPGAGPGTVRGAGIQGMRERAQMVGGELTVGPPERGGAGTVVRLRVPHEGAP
ncbi:HAMP domain-containing sensor histidine kinase [Phycicoccus avicenniae]|uniref:HAMP domain-containing sensor histidine kinase n=1 Tax=Phycicoccus avicenniae TaxID=2828860 RepID=UPI003D29B3F2